jgi:hypothetical protein
VGIAAAISGALLERAEKLVRVRVKKFGSPLPERSSSTMLTPPELPKAGMAGGGNENARPCFDAAKLLRQILLNRSELLVFALLRWSQS